MTPQPTRPDPAVVYDDSMPWWMVSAFTVVITLVVLVLAQPVIEACAR